MILVHLSKSWPDVVAGRRDAAEITLGEWALISDAAADKYGDVILGVHQNEVVTAYEVTGWTRDPANGRVTFAGTPSADWAHLVGGPNPGKAWVKGQARPVQYLATDDLRVGTVEPEMLDGGTVQRAVISGFTLTVDGDGNATLLTPAGASVTVVSVKPRADG